MTALPLDLLPDSATVRPDGGLEIGGLDVVDLAGEFGTPLFVYDEDHLRARCQEAVSAFPDGASYATKAFTCMAMVRLAHEEGMSLDVSTGGEIQVALAAGAPAEDLVFHGNNKSVSELEMALAAGVGRIVVDSFAEIDRLESVVSGGAMAPKVLIRVNPGVEAHTHEYLQTGVEDSKFGLSTVDGSARAAYERLEKSTAVELAGLHVHVGSQVFDVGSFRNVVAELGPLVRDLRPEEFSIGGGLGVAYVEGEQAPTITEWGRAVHSAAEEAGIEAHIMAEPGRAIVAAAAVTLYSAGTIKEIPSIRTYVSVDGGMSDNPRPVLYGSGYEVFLPRSTDSERAMPVRVVGKHCESGDVLVRDGHLPSSLEQGDIVATPVTGAYGHSMGSNYNMVLRPPVVFVKNGDARLVIRRETYDDLLTRDLAVLDAVD